MANAGVYTLLASPELLLLLLDVAVSQLGCSPIRVVSAEVEKVNERTSGRRTTVGDKNRWL